MIRIITMLFLVGCVERPKLYPQYSNTPETPTQFKVITQQKDKQQHGY